MSERIGTHGLALVEGSDTLRQAAVDVPNANARAVEAALSACATEEYVDDAIDGALEAIANGSY